MKSLDTFFAMGSIGVVVTALLHMLIASITGNGSLLTWAPIYVVWIVFMGLGFIRMMREPRPDA